MSQRIFWHDVKLFLRIFCILFAITFFIFDGTAFVSIIAYKTTKFFTAIATTLSKPPQLGNILVTTTTLVPPVPPVPVEAQKNNLLILPEFNITAPIWTVEKPDLKLIYKTLKLGVVLYPGTAFPGQGYSIIIGHSSQYPWQPGRYKSVFSLLSELKVGDKIYLYWDNKPLVFEVTAKTVFLPWPKGNETTETIFPPEGKKPILILQSCWPVGVAYKRVAVKAILK